MRSLNIRIQLKHSNNLTYYLEELRARMKLQKGLIVAGFCLLMVLAMSIPIASAQILDGAWFKMKLNAKGHKYNSITGNSHSYNFSVPVYLYLKWDYDFGKYKCAVWTEQDGGWATYSDSDTAVLETVGPNEKFVSHKYLLIKLPGNNWIRTYHTPVINIQKDARGALAKATWKGTGEVFDGSFDSEKKNYYGYFTLSGTTVDPLKLPFIPVL
jgi:hypothetical protein